MWRMVSASLVRTMWISIAKAVAIDFSAINVRKATSDLIASVYPVQTDLVGSVKVAQLVGVKYAQMTTL